VNKPPKLSETQAKEVPIEVLPPETEESGKAQGAEGPPIHALSALLLVAVDNLWTLVDWTVLSWIITIPLSFITVFFPVFFLQKFLKKDSNGRALAFALLLGGLAAIPTSITGTPVGVGLLAWTGFSKLFGKSSSK
jgi:hypothetical protein